MTGFSTPSSVLGAVAANSARAHAAGAPCAADGGMVDWPADQVKACKEDRLKPAWVKACPYKFNSDL